MNARQSYLRFGYFARDAVWSLETSLICILLSASRDVHFDKNDMLLKWSIVKSTSYSKPQRNAYPLKDTALLCDFLILFVRNPMICFYE